MAKKRVNERVSIARIYARFVDQRFERSANNRILRQVQFTSVDPLSGCILRAAEGFRFGRRLYLAVVVALVCSSS
jgi:hypothetical protein